MTVSHGAMVGTEEVRSSGEATSADPRRSQENRNSGLATCSGCAPSPYVPHTRQSPRDASVTRRLFLAAFGLGPIPESHQLQCGRQGWPHCIYMTQMTVIS